MSARDRRVRADQDRDRRLALTQNPRRALARIEGRRAQNGAATLREANGVCSVCGRPTAGLVATPRRGAGYDVTCLKPNTCPNQKEINHG